MCGAISSVRFLLFFISQDVLLVVGCGAICVGRDVSAGGGIVIVVRRGANVKNVFIYMLSVKKKARL